jgi:hypothetical protein
MAVALKKSGFKLGFSGGLKIKIVGADVLDGPISTR